MALSSQGRVFSWGYGEDGQLGHGDTNDYLLPKEVEYFKKSNTKASFIACGHSHSGCISDSQSPQLYLWGSNPDCRLMTEENVSKMLPSLTILEQAKNHMNEKDPVRSEYFEPCFLSLGVTHTAVITRSGEVFTAGSKFDGQLGVRFSKTYSSQANMISTQQSESSFLNQYKDPKELIETSSAINKILMFGPHNKAIQVSCGDCFTLVLDEKN
jgi:alpha-tubulin suppressor-like RCC1 family protein